MFSYIVYPLFIAKWREYYLKLGRKERKEESKRETYSRALYMYRYIEGEKTIQKKKKEGYI